MFFFLDHDWPNPETLPPSFHYSGFSILPKNLGWESLLRVHWELGGKQIFQTLSLPFTPGCPSWQFRLRRGPCLHKLKLFILGVEMINRRTSLECKRFLWGVNESGCSKVATWNWPVSGILFQDVIASTSLSRELLLIVTGALWHVFGSKPSLSFSNRPQNVEHPTTEVGVWPRTHVSCIESFEKNILAITAKKTNLNHFIHRNYDTWKS